IPLLAAGLVAAVVLSRRSGRGDGALAVAGSVAVEPGRAAPGFGDWSSVRGESDGLAPTTPAFRLGVRVVDVALAGRAGDRAAMDRYSTAAARLAAGTETGALVVPRLEQLGRGTPPTTGDLPDIVAAIRTASGSTWWFDAGAWSEAARVAAGAGQAEF